MSDWKSRAVKVQGDSVETPRNPASTTSNDWKSRAKPIAAPSENDQWKDFADKLQAKGIEEARPIEAALTGAAKQVPVLGSYINNIASGGNKLAAKMHDKVYGGNLADSPAFDYVENRDRLNKEDEKLKEENTGAYGTGAGLSLAAQLAIGSGASPAIKNTGFAKKLAKAIALGGTAAAIENPGDTAGKIDPIQAGDRAVNGGVGALLTGGLEGVVPVVSKGLQLGGKVATKVADSAAFNALRGYKKDLKNIITKGTQRQVGRAALDEGIIRNIPANIETLADRAGTKAHTVGESYGNMVNDLSSLPDSSINKNSVADAARVQLRIDPSVPGAARSNSSMDNLVSEFQLGGKEAIPSSNGISIADAQNLKTQIGKQAEFGKYFEITPDATKANRQLYHNLNTTIDDTADRLAKSDRSPVSSEDLQGLRKRLTNLKTIEGVTSNRVIGDMANRAASPSDYAAALAGYLAHGPIGATAGVANKVARKYGSQVVAKQADNLARGLSRANKSINSREMNDLGRYFLGSLAERQSHE